MEFNRIQAAVQADLPASLMYIITGLLLAIQVVCQQSLYLIQSVLSELTGLTVHWHQAGNQEYR